MHDKAGTGMVGMTMGLLRDQGRYREAKEMYGDVLAVSARRALKMTLLERQKRTSRI